MTVAVQGHRLLRLAPRDMWHRSFRVLGLNMDTTFSYAPDMSDVSASDAARLLAGLRRQESRVCEVCGTEVIATTRRRYCSQPCSLKADYARHAEARRAKRRARYQRQKDQPPSDKT